jgi:TatD DNase family protein
VGIHPNHCAEAAAQDFNRIAELAQDPAVVAIGETGLDNYWKYTPLELQKEFLRRHLNLARQVNKPIILHNRDANGPLLEELSRAAADGPLRGVMHSFCADAATAEAGLQLGLYLSFSGMLTYKANQSLRDLVSLLPRDRLLIETDAPYLAPEPHRGKTNEPAWVVPVGVKLAQCLGISADQAASLTTENARRCFGIEAFAPTLGSSALL